jgi:hypothetical protein
MVADEPSELLQPKVLHPIVYGCVRLAALYVFTSVTLLGIFKTFH